MNNDKYLQVAVEAAKKGGSIILRGAGKGARGRVDRKRAFDYVTETDREAERVIIGEIKKRFPDHGFLAEESARDRQEGGYRWIIDPLDGTTNFIHGFPMFCVSIALELAGGIIVAVVLNPLSDELFAAKKGEGAFMNGERICVSSPAELEDCLILTGFPFRFKELTDNYLGMFKSVFLKVADLRRCGSAALDLAHVAAGRGDGFFEIGLSAWDMAAGSLLVTEAGGVVTDFSGGPGYLDSGNVIAAGPKVHAMLLENIRSCRDGCPSR
ncbi:MAG: inositol monophosphatase family protein [Pseudomonadota bacterium]